MPKKRSAAEQRQYDEGFAEGREEGLADGQEAGRAEFRDRVKAICESDEAGRRFASAVKVALSTDMGVDEARDFLAELPEDEIKGNGKSDFARAMATGNPEVGAGFEDDDDDDRPRDDVAAITAAYRKSGGETQ